jgi:hypothetical protein
VIHHFFNKVYTDYKDKFNMWRMSHYKGGFLSEMSTGKSKDPILDSIFKGTELVDDEQTVAKSFERRQERRKHELAELAAAKKQAGFRRQVGSKSSMVISKPPPKITATS